MKFRNPETGEVFDVTVDVPETGFCYGMSCFKCPIYRKYPYCEEFINNYPSKAAALMGYEVISEPGDDAAPIETLAETFNKIGKEVNMDNTDQQAKADQDKPHPSWVPVALIEGVMAVREMGTKKYGDPESGLLHLEHICCNAAFLLEMKKDYQSAEIQLKMRFLFFVLLFLSD